MGTLGTTFTDRVCTGATGTGSACQPARVSPIHVNLPELATATLKGIEWHGYRLGGNASPDTPSTATAQDWKPVADNEEIDSVPGVFKVVVDAADAQGRWKPESTHKVLSALRWMRATRPGPFGR